MYLDLVCFQASNFSSPPVRWLEISINGWPIQTIYRGGRKPCQSPVVLTIDREVIPDRSLDIWLSPSPNGFFSIWDAFVSPILEENVTLVNDAS